MHKGKNCGVQFVVVSICDKIRLNYGMRQAADDLKNRE